MTITERTSVNPRVRLELYTFQMNRVKRRESNPGPSI